MKTCQLLTALLFGFLLSHASQAALVASWELEEGSGTTTTESVTSTTSSAFGTGVSWSTDTSGAESDSSITFPNTADGHIKTGLNANALGIAGSGAKTIVGWFKTSSTEQQMFFGYSPSNGTGAGQDLRLGHDASGFMRFEVSSGFAVNSSITINDGQWHKLAVIINPNDTTDNVEFYLDGSILSPTSSNGRLINTLGSTATSNFNQVILGNGNPLSDTQSWNGLIDEVRVYDSALTLGELDALSAIPEPAASALGVLGMLAFLRRRR
ncbi:MAG: LamG-like jellyroll fold domain-containing protein [Luteolibacter sp.]